MAPNITGRSASRESADRVHVPGVTGSYVLAAAALAPNVNPISRPWTKAHRWLNGDEVAISNIRR